MPLEAIQETEGLKQHAELQTGCEAQMRLDVCSGCDACWLRCAHDVPASCEEWDRLQQYLADASEAEKTQIARVLAQDKTVDLGDEVTVQMCRYFDMETHACAVYPARPLACRLLGHVPWMPCPIEKVPAVLPVDNALALMRSYARFTRHTFAEWEELAANKRK